MNDNLKRWLRTHIFRTWNLVLGWVVIVMGFVYRPDLLKWWLRSVTAGIEKVSDQLPPPWAISSKYLYAQSGRRFGFRLDHRMAHCRSLAQFTSAMTEEAPDLVDVFYVPFVRALGNLVITYAQAEAAILDLINELRGGDDEGSAHALLGSKGAPARIYDLIEAAGIDGYELKELRQAIHDYWNDRERRNRLVHDEWFVAMFSDGESAGIRGLPRRKTTGFVFDNPTPEQVWELASSFQKYDNLFSHTAYVLRKKREGDGD